MKVSKNHSKGSYAPKVNNVGNKTLNSSRQHQHHKSHSNFKDLPIHNGNEKKSSEITFQKINGKTIDLSNSFSLEERKNQPEAGVLIQALVKLITESNKPEPEILERVNLLKEIDERKLNLLEALKLVEKQKFAADTYIYGKLICLATPFKNSLLIFDSMPQSFKNSYLCNIFLKSCKEFNEFQTADNVFQFLVGKNLANERTFTNYIDLCGANGEFDMADKAFALALQSRFVNDYTCSCYLKACFECKKFEGAEAVFNYAVENELVNGIIYHLYIEILLTCKGLKAGGALFKKVEFLLEDYIKKGSHPELDFHKGFKPGSALIALHLYLVENPNISKITVITGIGQKNKGNYLKFRNTLEKLIEKYLPNYHVDLDDKNDGVIIVSPRVSFKRHNSSDKY